MRVERCLNTGTPNERAPLAEQKIVYKRYASLFFIACVNNDENELYTLEAIHQYVEVLDRYFGNVRPNAPTPPRPLGLTGYLSCRSASLISFSTSTRCVFFLAGARSACGLTNNAHGCRRSSFSMRFSSVASCRRRARRQS